MKTFKEYLEEILGLYKRSADETDADRTKAAKDVLRQMEKERAKSKGEKPKPMWWEK